MSSKRVYQILVGGIVLTCLGLLVGAYFLNGLLQNQAQTLTEQHKQLAVLDGRETALKLAKKDVERYQSLAAIAKSIVPQDKSQAQAVREIVKLANRNGVALGGFSFPASTLGTTGTTKTTQKPSLSQLTPVKGISGVLSLQIIVQSDTDNPSPYTSFLNFLRDLEQNRRTALVTSITITPAKNPANIGFTLTLEEYIKP
jgi:hypothetical protein